MLDTYEIALDRFYQSLEDADQSWDHFYQEQETWYEHYQDADDEELALFLEREGGRCLQALSQVEDLTLHSPRP